MRLYLRICSVVLFLIPTWSGPASAQINRPEITVDVRHEKGADREAPAYLNGYRERIDGQIIQYHSSHPDAEAALIVRANSEAHSATWLTDTIPQHADGDSLQFLWLAGLERSGWGESKTGHAFNFLINGQHWFTFRNFKDSTAPHWSVRGKDGATLSFSAQMADRFGDQFGYMYLKLPGKDFPSNAPLTLQVVGEDANSPEWFMAFQYHFSFSPQVRGEPAMFKKSNGATQVLRLSLDNLTAGKTIEIHTPDGSTINQPLNVGANIYSLPIPAVDSTATATLVFRVDNREISRRQIGVKPVARRELYLLPHSHNDIGYTDVQTAVERKQWHNIDEALRLIAITRDYPPDARFKWNVEVLWPLESYLRSASSGKKNEVIAAIRDGSIGLNALYANELTGLATAAEMSHFTDYAREFSRTYSIPISTALMSDIPGFTWGIVPALAQNGVRYFASGPNSGDRIGYVLQQWGDKPFYWASQSGKEKVLFWVAGAGYSTFHEGTLAKLGDEKVMKLVRRLDESQYPYDIVQLPYTLGDNGPPDSTLSDFVRRWNDTYLSPRLIISTHAAMFAEFEKRYGKQLPVLQGDFTPYWEDGALSSAFETALNRKAVDQLVEGEAIWALHDPLHFPAQESAEAWRNVVLYDEHTWGADKSVSDPDDPGVRAQWKIKRQFALDADSLSRDILAMAFPKPRGVSGANIIDVYNPTGWERSEVVTVLANISRAGDRVVDGRDRPVPSQRLSTGELAFVADNLAPISAKRFVVMKGKSRKPAALAPYDGVLENSAIRLAVDASTGAIKDLVWKSKHLDFISPGHGLNQYLYVPGTNPDSAQTLRNVRVRVKEWGPVVQSVVVEGNAPGCRSYSTEIRIAEGSELVEIATTYDKAPVRSKEAIHVAFPFSIANAQLRYDVGGAIVRPESDQLKGACKNFFSVQSWVDVSNAEGGITLATPDAPLVEFGEITAEKPWRTSAAISPTVYSYVMNNYWHTNYRADQEGTVVIRYVLRPHGSFAPEEAAKFGLACREPLIVRQATPGTRAIPSLVRLASSGLVLESMKPLTGGRNFLLYIYNPTGGDQQAQLIWGRKVKVRLQTSSASGDAGDLLPEKFVVPAYGTMYVRAEMEH